MDWIERILRNRFLSGYRGTEVTAAENDQVLLWWMASPDRYQVYYGYLRTEVVSQVQWQRLVPGKERGE